MSLRAIARQSHTIQSKVMSQARRVTSRFSAQILSVFCKGVIVNY